MQGHKPNYWYKKVVLEHSTICFDNRVLIKQKFLRIIAQRWIELFFVLPLFHSQVRLQACFSINVCQTKKDKL